MNVHSTRFYIKVVSAIGLAMGMLATAGDAFSKDNAAVVYLQVNWGFPKNNVITVILVCVIVLTVVLVADGIRSTLRANRKTCTPEEQQRARKTYLGLMKKDIANRLANSIHKARYIDLQLKESGTHVATPHFTVQNKEEEDTRIIDSIDPLLDAGEFRLLLLGAPGAGKTTTVLNSMQRCITAAIADEAAPIPILINLSKYRRQEGSNGLGLKGFFSGTNKTLGTMNLDEWVIQSMAGLKRSGLTKAIVGEWLKEQKLVLFLDGLDEAEELIRNLIVDKINDFITRYSSASILVCSRLADYEALVNTSRVRLELDAAVVINPMTPEQITAYLAEAQVPHLQILLDQDEELKEMARSPLDLSIMVLASRYTDFQSVTAQHTHSITRKRVALFDAYVEAMMQREKRKKTTGTRLHDADFTEIPIPARKKVAIHRYLGWMAQVQSENNLSTFTPHQLYEYQSEGSVQRAEVFRLDGPVQVVNGVLLLTALSILSWLYAGRFPLGVLIGAPLLFTAANFYVSYLRSEPIQTKVTYVIGFFIGWPLIMLVFSLVAVPMALTMGTVAGLGFMGFLFLVLFRFLAYDDDDGSTIKEVIQSIKHHSRNFNLVCALLVLMPLVFVFFFDGISYPQWIFLYMVAVIVNLAVRNEYRIAQRHLLVFNLYVLSAAIPGLLLLTDPWQLVYVLFPIAMIFGLQLYASEKLNYGAWPLFASGFAGAIGALFFPPLAVLGVALVLPVLLLLIAKKKIVHGSAWVLNFFGSRALLVQYMVSGKLPVRFQAFLHYATRSLLLRKHLDEYEFIHRRIRDYFAIRQYLPLLSNASADDRANAVLQVSRLRDASCDVLLEMIDDKEKNIRLTCLNGLGEIGSVTAAKSLLEAIRNTSGDMHQQAVLMLGKVKDVAATPVLIRGLNEYPVDSPVFDACIQALGENLYRLSAWDNDVKKKAYLELPSARYTSALAVHLSNKELMTKVRKIESMLYTMYGQVGDLSRSPGAITDGLSGFDNDDLAEFVVEGAEFSTYAFPLLLNRDASLATRKLLEKIARKELSTIYLKKKLLIRVYPEIEKILQGNDQEYLASALHFLISYPNKRMEPVLIPAMASWSTEEQKLVLTILGKCGTVLSLPVILAALRNKDLSTDATTALQHLVQSMGLHLVGMERSLDFLGWPLFLREIRTRKVIRVLAAHLKDDDAVIQKAVIITLSQIDHSRVLPLLWGSFSNEDPNLYEALIPALAVHNKQQVLGKLPDLFLRYPQLRAVIISALIKFEAGTVIEALYDQLSNTGTVATGNNEAMIYYLSAYFVHTDKREKAVELLFDHLGEKLSFRNNANGWNSRRDLIADSLMTEVIQAKDSLVLLHNQEPDTVVRKSFVEKGLLYDLSLRTIFQIKRISEQYRILVNLAWQYDGELARRLCLEFLSGRSNELEKILLTQLDQAEPGNRKVLLIALIAAYDLRSLGPHLGTFLDQTDQELVGITIDALGYLKAGWAWDGIARHLQSTDATIARKALAALKRLCDIPDMKLGNILQLVYNAEHFRLLLADDLYAPVLQQLPYDDLVQLAAHEQPRYRYLATCYMGILGHGSTLSRLQELLEDHAPVDPLPGYDHSTVSEGALYALDKIGSPSAKALADAWRKKQSFP